MKSKVFGMKMIINAGKTLPLHLDTNLTIR